MRGLNELTLMGHLGKDPEFKTLDDGINVAKFSLATSESFKDQEENLQIQSEWHSVVSWEVLQILHRNYLKKRV